MALPAFDPAAREFAESFRRRHDPGHAPDEGCAALSLLHDRLYTGPLAPHLWLDLPYTPHITIGRSPDRARAKAWCDMLNQSGVDTPGRVDSLTVGTLEAGRFITIATMALPSPPA